jgi:GT2 family glycosyltransferase
VDEPVRPRVLLVVPSLGNRPALLKQTLYSIARQEEPADLVVVVPADREEARTLAHAVGAAVLDDPGGLSSAINLGWTQVKPHHRYVNWLGDDDLLAPGSLAATTGALDRDPAAVAAFGYCDYIDHQGRRLFTSGAGRLAPWLMTWGPDLVPQPGALFRWSQVQAVGGLDESLSYAMDLDLLLRLRRLGPMINCGRVLASFRWHPDSTTVANRGRSLAESAAVKRRYVSTWLRPCLTASDPLVRISTRMAAHRVSAISRGRARACLEQP